MTTLLSMIRPLLHSLKAFAVVLLCTGLVNLGPGPSVARAALVPTFSAANEDTRAQLHALVDRHEVQRELAAYGVGADEAHARVAALAPEELAEIAGRLDELPAGGSSLGGIVLAAALVFVALIVTDALGITDVFPWVKKPQPR